MSIRAMTFIVDTLEQEIKELRYQIVEDSISTLHPATFKNPTISSKDINLGSIVQTDLYILNQVGSTTQQIRMANLGYSQVENTQSQIERAKSNELWRLKRIQRYWVEIHKKFSIPFACIIFVLLGAPIGILTRKGNVGYAAIIALSLIHI